jgi:phosphatidylinositol alpha-1,6-mannosyltransferase
VLLPIASVRREIGAAAARVGAELVVLDPAVPVGMLGPRLGLPYAVFMHGSELVGRLPVGRAAMGRVLRGAQFVIAAGSYPAAETRRVAARRTPRIVEVPCGVDTTRFRPLSVDERLAARRRWSLPEESPVVVGLSRLVRRKGFDVLIEAVAGIDGATLVLGGSGRDRGRLERIANGRVRFLGRVDDDDLPSFYGCADAFAMLCRDQWGGLEREGFGIVFVEAAACGVPQVAGRSGGSADAVADGETGVVLDDPGDVDAAAAALRRVLEPATNRAMAEASRQRAVEEFDYDALAARLEAALS